MRPAPHPCGTYVSGVVVAVAACECCYDVTGRLSRLALTRAGHVQRPCPVTGRYGVDRARVREAVAASATFGGP